MKRISVIVLILMTVLPPAASGQAPRHRKGAAAAAVTMRLDYAGAEALLDALGRDSLNEADVDDLLRVQGVRAMVGNVTRFFPQLGPGEFRQDVQAFARTEQAPPNDRYFQLTLVWRAREQVRNLVAAIRSEEREIVRRTLLQLKRYRPDTGPLAIEVFFVAGGVSDGFVFDDNTEPAFYINLSRADGDADAVVMNMAHEAYHVMQKAAQRRTPGLRLFADSSERLPPAERLLVVTLAEGTANYVVDPTRSTAAGPGVERLRAAYRRNATPARIAENFALFDTVLDDLRGGRMTWDEAYEKGFTGNNDDRFYAVGYEMTKALDRYCGRKCVGGLFQKPPVEFFRSYIALYRRHPGIRGRFSQETERFIASPERQLR